MVNDIIIIIIIHEQRRRNNVTFQSSSRTCVRGRAVHEAVLNL